MFLLVLDGNEVLAVSFRGGLLCDANCSHADHYGFYNYILLFKYVSMKRCTPPFGCST